MTEEFLKFLMNNGLGVLITVGVLWIAYKSVTGIGTFITGTVLPMFQEHLHNQDTYRQGMQELMAVVSTRLASIERKLGIGD